MPGKSPSPEHHAFVKAVAGALRRRCGVIEGMRLVVATSGGGDSVALLRAMAALATRRNWRLTLAVGHVQHHLRADVHAEADAAFVADLARRLDLPCLRADLTPPRSTVPVNLEAWARRARYGALAEMARAFDATAILTAHHADDQLETLLMRLLRGASVTGLRGIAWRRMLSHDEMAQGTPDHQNSPNPRPLLLRPMLATDRTMARTFLTGIGQTWCEDHTNHDVSRLRAHLRQGVLPLLHQIRADAPARAVALGDHLREMTHLLETTVAKAADRVALVDGEPVLERSDARLLPRVVLAGLLRRLLAQAGVGRDRLGSRTIKPVLRAISDTQGGERLFDLGGGTRIAVTRDAITIKPSRTTP